MVTVFHYGPVNAVTLLIKGFASLNFDFLTQSCQSFPHQNFVLYGNTLTLYIEIIIVIKINNMQCIEVKIFTLLYITIAHTYMHSIYAYHLLTINNYNVSVSMD